MEIKDTNIRKQCIPLTNTLFAYHVSFIGISVMNQNGGAISISSPKFENMTISYCRFTQCLISNTIAVSSEFQGACAFVYTLKQFLMDRNCMSVCRSDVEGVTHISAREISYFNQTSTNEIESNKICMNSNTNFNFCNHTTYRDRIFKFGDVDSYQAHKYCIFSIVHSEEVNLVNVSNCQFWYFDVEQIKITNAHFCSFIDIIANTFYAKNFSDCYFDKNIPDIYITGTIVTAELPNPIDVVVVDDSCPIILDENKTIQKESFSESINSLAFYGNINILDCTFNFLNIYSNFPAIYVDSIKSYPSDIRLNTENTNFYNCLSYEKPACVSFKPSLGQVNILKCCAYKCYGGSACFISSTSEFVSLNDTTITGCYFREQNSALKNQMIVSFDNLGKDKTVSLFGNNFSANFNNLFGVGEFKQRSDISLASIEYTLFSDIESLKNIIGYYKIIINSCIFQNCKCGQEYTQFGLIRPDTTFKSFSLNISNSSFVNCNNMNKDANINNCCFDKQCKSISYNNIYHKLCFLAEPVDKLKWYHILIICLCVGIVVALAITGFAVYFYFKRTYNVEKRLEMEREIVTDFG